MTAQCPSPATWRLIHLFLHANGLVFTFERQLGGRLGWGHGDSPVCTPLRAPDLTYDALQPPRSHVTRQDSTPEVPARILKPLRVVCRSVPGVLRRQVRSMSRQSPT